MRKLLSYRAPYGCPLANPLKLRRCQLATSFAGFPAAYRPRLRLSLRSAEDNNAAAVTDCGRSRTLQIYGAEPEPDRKAQIQVNRCVSRQASCGYPSHQR